MQAEAVAALITGGAALVVGVGSFATTLVLDSRNREERKTRDVAERQERTKAAEAERREERFESKRSAYGDFTRLCNEGFEAVHKYYQASFRAVSGPPRLSDLFDGSYDGSSHRPRGSQEDAAAAFTAHDRVIAALQQLAYIAPDGVFEAATNLAFAVTRCSRAAITVHQIIPSGSPEQKAAMQRYDEAALGFGESDDAFTTAARADVDVSSGSR